MLIKCPACRGLIRDPRTAVETGELLSQRTADGWPFVRGQHQECGARLRAFLGTDPRWEVDRSPAVLKPVPRGEDDPLRTTNSHLHPKGELSLRLRELIESNQREWERQFGRR